MLAWLGGGVLVAVLLYAGLRWFAKARAADIALALRTFAAVFSALASTGLVFSHRFGFAVITVAATAMAVRSLVLAGRTMGGGASGPRLVRGGRRDRAPRHAARPADRPHRRHGPPWPARGSAPEPARSAGPARAARDRAPRRPAVGRPARGLPRPSRARLAALRRRCPARRRRPARRWTRRRRSASWACPPAPRPTMTAADHDDTGSDRRRRIRDAVEAALSDIILLGTEAHVRLAERAARELVAGRPVRIEELVVSLRAFIREALDLDPFRPTSVFRCRARRARRAQAGAARANAAMTALVRAAAAEA